MKDALIVFTRLPVPGKAKTRLIPSLGAERAAELQRQMTLHCVGRAWAYCATSGRIFLTVAYEGGTHDEMRRWLGPLHYQGQSEGDLGSRLREAIDRANTEGANRIVVIGTDCPEIDEVLLDSSFARLNEADVVIGPALDGGYYLIGVREPQSCLFKDIPWSTDRVLDVTLDRAREARLTVEILSRLSDVDEPSDLPQAEAALAKSQTVSVIVPTLNEANALESLLPALKAGNPLQIILADGGSTDETAEIAARHEVEIIHAPSGRARQMNAAATLARGEYLLFLHADTLPPPDFVGIVVRHLACPGVAGGAFRFALRDPIRFKSVIEGMTRLRGSLLGKPYGDQGLFLRRSLFCALGGFPDWPILEDLEMVKRLRRMGKFALSPDFAPTSARRWRSGGVVMTWLRHQLILVGHSLGVPLSILSRLR